MKGVRDLPPRVGAAYDRVVAQVSEQDRLHFERVAEAEREMETDERRRAGREAPGAKILQALKWSDALRADPPHDYSDEVVDAQGSLRRIWLERTRRTRGT